MANGTTTTAVNQFKQSTSSFKTILGIILAVVTLFSLAGGVIYEAGSKDAEFENLQKIIVELKSEIIKNGHMDQQRATKLIDIDKKLAVLIQKVDDLKK